MAINIRLHDGSVRLFESGITSAEIAHKVNPSLAEEILASEVNGHLWDCSRPILVDSSIKFITWDDLEGKKMFWHSTAHLMAEAIESFYPNAKFGIGPPIENGFYYDVDFGDAILLDDFSIILEKKMHSLASLKSKYERFEINKEYALSFFEKKNNEYKLELINSLKDGTITFYKQGQFTDLCKGPHIPHTGFIKAVKILNLASAYWRGNEKNKQLTRIYGISFPDKNKLQEYLTLLEEAHKRNHQKIGKELKLFAFSQNVGVGLPLWLPRGTIVRDNLVQFLCKAQKNLGYSPVVTPHIAQKELYIISGHYDKYGKDSFQSIKTPNVGEEFFLKAMNCPHHCEIYKNELRSYKDLPIRYSEFGTVYRYEQHGELRGLARTRGFTQDDAHIFCTPEQVKSEFASVIDLTLYVFKSLGFDNYKAQLSLRDPKTPEKYIGKIEDWNIAESAIKEIVQEKGLPFTTTFGEAAFYGPKIDFMIKDALGREWQLGTIQLDNQLPERFNLEYVGADGNKHKPVMIHRAPFGSLERFIAILLEHTAGKLPLWLSPDQVAILPVSEKYLDYANYVYKELTKNNVTVHLDNRNQKIGKKIRDAEILKIPYMLIIGESEKTENTVSLRIQSLGDQGKMKLEEFLSFVTDKINEQTCFNCNS